MSGRKQRSSTNKTKNNRKIKCQTSQTNVMPAKQMESRVNEGARAPLPANIPIEEMTSRERAKDLYSLHTIHEKILKDAAQMQFYRYAIYDNRHLFRNKVSVFRGLVYLVLIRFAFCFCLRWYLTSTVALVFCRCLLPRRVQNISMPSTNRISCSSPGEWFKTANLVIRLL